jgi:hypothetical protein
MSATAFGASDVLSLGADWEPQNKNETTAYERAEATGANGDRIASSTHAALQTGTCPYIYTGAETDFSTALTAASAHVGQAANSLLVNQIEIDYAPCAEGKKPVVTFSYRNDITAASNVYLPSISLTTTAATVPDLLANGDADSECTSAKYTIRCEVGQDRDADGAIIAGATYHGEEQVDLEFYGVPTLTSTGWDAITNPGATDSNAEYSTSSYSFVKGILRTTTTTTT